MTAPLIRLSKSIVGREEADAVTRVLLEDGYLGMGREVQQFEQEIAAFLGVESDHVLCVNSGTAAVHLAVQGAVPAGGEVLVQSLTFVATFQAITAAGAVPVACDVLPDTVRIDLADAERRLTPATRAIMPVHYASNPAGLREVYAFAGRHNLRVIEDAAHAFGCTVDGTRVGSTGDVVCFSFDGIKNITSGEGGAVVTADPQVRRTVADTRLLGVQRDSERRFAGERSWDFDVTEQGYRFHMSNLFAAIGRVQLRRLGSEFGARRRTLAERYRARLRGAAGIRLFDVDLESVIPHLQPIRVLDGRRDAVRAALAAEQIESGIHYKPNHLLTRYGGGTTSLPVTEQLYGEILSLPLHPGLSEADVDRVSDCVLASIASAAAHS